MVMPEPDGQWNGSHPGRVICAVATLMALEAISLAAASSLHFAGLVHGRTSSFDPDAAGIAEAVIGAVLGAAAAALFRGGIRARPIGIGASSFALVGFLVGISETARGGHAPDIAYHATVIPLLILGLTLLVRTRQPSAGLRSRPPRRRG
jgi:hypothetical protein